MSRNYNKADAVISNCDLANVLDDWEADIGNCDQERELTDFRAGREGFNISVDCHPDDDDTVYIDGSTRELHDLLHSAQDYVILVYDNGLHQIWIRGVRKFFLAVETVR